MISPIHQTPEEKLASTAEGTVQAIQENTRKVEEVANAVKEHQRTSSDKTVEAMGFQGMIGRQDQTTRKVEEVKSAALITNKLLKDIANKDSMKVELANDPNELAVAFWSMLRGGPGDDGHTPEKGKDYFTKEEIDEFKKQVTPKKGVDYRDGIDGDSAVTPLRGKDYFTEQEIADFKKQVTPVKGKDYRDGTNGHTPTKGVDYQDGKDGSPDEPDQIVEKVNLSSKIIDAERVRGLADVIRQVDRIGTNPTGATEGGGGNIIAFYSAGTRLEHITEINFSTNLTATYSGNGRLTLTAAAGSGTFGIIEVTGTVDDSNTSFTAASAPALVVINGVSYRDGHGVSISGTAITTDNPVGVNGDIYAL